MLKSLLKPHYRKIMSKLRESLHLDEHTRLLTHVITQNNELKQDIQTLQHEVNMLNILIGGIEPASGQDAFTITPEDTTRDLINILSPRRQDEVEIAQMLTLIKKDLFRNKKVCIIGTQNAFLQNEIKNRGAEQVYSIELISHTAYGQQSGTVYVYPSHVGTVSFPHTYDLLFISHPAASSYLLKRKLFGLGAKITEKGLFVLSGTDAQRAHLTSLITASGFNEVHAVPQGKTTRFDYMELREVPNYSHSKGQETMLYEADKMPSVT